MATILNIDTSGSICSVALAKDGEIVLGFESDTKMDHSRTLAPFVDKCMNWVREKGEKLDAVSVVNGPGSYTGLRIGLSLAKGLCYGLDIPLIALSSLMVMGVRAVFSFSDFSGSETIVPMIDARRMEVYTCVLDSSLNYEMPPQALILDENSFISLKDKEKVIFIGDGTTKFENLYKGENGVWMGPLQSHAKYMVALSEKYFRENKFSDVAYTVPGYLKEYMATQPKNRL